MSYRIRVIEGRATAAGKEISKESGYKINASQQLTRVGAGSRCDLRVELPGVNDGLLFQIEYGRVDGKSSFKIIPQVDDALELDGRSINIGDDVQWKLGSRVIIYDKVVLELAYKKSSRPKPSEERDAVGASEGAATEETWKRRPTSSSRRPDRSEDDLGEVFAQTPSRREKEGERGSSSPAPKSPPSQDKAAQSSKERAQLLVIVFCFTLAGFLMLKAFLPAAETKAETADEYDDVAARKIAERDDALLKAFDKAVWAEKANQEKSIELFEEVRNKARAKFKTELVASESEEKTRVCKFFNYLEKKINPPPKEEDE